MAPPAFTHVPTSRRPQVARTWYRCSCKPVASCSLATIHILCTTSRLVLQSISHTCQGCCSPISPPPSWGSTRASWDLYTRLRRHGCCTSAQVAALLPSCPPSWLILIWSIGTMLTWLRFGCCWRFPGWHFLVLVPPQLRSRAA